MIRLYCQLCGKRFSDEQPLWRCSCGGLIDIEINARLSLRGLKKRPPGIWRYREMLPIREDKNIVSFNEGFTPLVEIKIKNKPGLFKMDFLFPTGSFKDRGASIMVSKIKELGIKKVLIDSSGNAGCAVSAYCAKAGIECMVLVPENTSEEKMKQIKSYGAKLYIVQGNRDETARVALKLAEKNYYASHYYNPFFFHGTKTFAYEISEQLGWRAPDTLILPVGNGTLILGAYIGFKELHNQGLIKKIPKLIGIQTKNCAPIYWMFKRHTNYVPILSTKPTVAEGIAVGIPPRANQIIRTIKMTKGTIITVSEREIKQSLEETNLSGIYIEPTSATAVAGVKKYLGLSDKKELIVSTFTGTGLKSHKL
uniref:Threonine synthase n=1 Tax=candidate division WOR-3 bacterium TaxID=2052148 RepID=A0A7V0Z6S8_UNCW3